MRRFITQFSTFAMLICASTHGITQNKSNLWTVHADAELANSTKVDRVSYPTEYTIFHLDLQQLKQLLIGAPERWKSPINSAITVAFPNSNGNLEHFKVMESPVVHPDLVIKYPGIKTYVAQGIEDPTAYMRFSVTQYGLHTMCLSGKQNTWYIDPYTADLEYYIVYNRKSLNGASKSFECLTDENVQLPSLKTPISGNTYKATNDQKMRTYRLAQSCTAEYGNYFANTAGQEIADIMAAMVVTINRVNGVYEVDLAITLEIIANNDQIMYYGNTNSDPWTSEWNNTTQSEIDSKIGSAGYDIGHNFNTTGGGNAGCIGCVCQNGSKGSAYTGRSNPVGDPFDIDYVAHEMGHQFGGYHTMNTCSRSGSGQTEVEPCSGSSIMGYAGICSVNVQNNSDAHFNYVNLRDISANIQPGGNSTCGAQQTLTNNPPTADAGNDYTIPQGTAFVLEGTATDADGMASLTYNWSQNDPEQAPSNNSPSSTWTQGPLYRAKLPITSPDRYMPQLSDVIAGNLSPTWEMTPTVGRNMEFAFVVRDNDMGGPQTEDDLMQVTVDGSSGPFTVTSQGSPVTWTSGTSETVTWNVAGTDGGAVSAANVNILLSTDGGYTYPFTLASGVPNNGSASVTVPSGAATTTARIMVRGAGNIFYALNGADFTVEDSEFAMNFSATTVEVCPPNNADFLMQYVTFLGFNETTVFSATGNPAGSTVSFSPTSAMNNNTSVTMSISGINASMAGSYTITVTGTAPSATKSVDLTLNVLDNVSGPTTLTFPADAATGVSIPTTFTWNAIAGAGIQYDIDIATDIGFSNIIENASGLTSTSYAASSLLGGITYYWRVNTYNICDTAGFSNTFSLTTSTCSQSMSVDIPVSVPHNGSNTSDLSIAVTGFISDVDVVNLEGEHTRMSDLTFTLTSPQGTSVVLWSSICGTADDWDLNLDDQAASATFPCPPTTQGTYQPQGNLSDFNGEDPAGVWTLTIDDGVWGRSATLNGWGLVICTAPCTLPDLPTVSATTNTICEGESTTLSVTGNLNSASDWQWYESSCTGSAIGNGTSINVTPSASTTYFVRGEGGCITPGSCNSITVDVNSTYAINASASICDGDSYTFPDGSSSSSATTQVSTLSSMHGCDSIITTVLTIDPVYSSTVNANICIGGTYTFPDGSTSTTSTVQVSTLASSMACDSVITTNLIVDTVIVLAESASICDGNSYTFPDGGTSSIDTVHTSYLIGLSGCDSNIVTTLTVNNVYNLNETVSICDGNTYTFPDGTTSSVTTMYTSVLTTADGCDSSIITDLTVNAVFAQNNSAKICDGDTYTFPNGNSSTTAMVDTSVFTSSNGCDSLIITDLTVDPAYNINESASFCEGQIYTFPDGTTTTSPTIHTSALSTLDGCDSLVITTLLLSSINLSVTNAGGTLIAGATGATYQWLDCNAGYAPIAGETNSSFTPIVTGSYAVAVTENGCTDTTGCLYVSVVGILENMQNVISIYPNPVRSDVTIDFGSLIGTKQVTLHDARGRLVYIAEGVTDQQHQINLATLSSGVYSLQVVGKEHTGVYRLVKTK